MRGLSFVALAFALLPLTVAEAQSDQADDEARIRFEAGRLAFDAGRFEEALEDFQRAYELSERSLLLYNIGVCLDRLERRREALTAFDQYLAANPEAENVGAVQRRADIIRAAIAREGEDGEDDADQTPTVAVGGSVDQDDSGPNGAAIGLLVAGGAVLVGGVVLLAVGVTDRSSVESAPDGVLWEDISGAAERAPILEAVGGVGLGVGVALAAVGVVLLVAGGDGDRASATLRVGPNGLRAEGTF